MVKLILLDRDGVINKELGAYVTNPIDFELLPHVIPNLLKLKRAGILVVVITNQGGIAKGLYAHQTLTQIHQKLKMALAEYHLFLMKFIIARITPNMVIVCAVNRAAS